MTIMKSKKKTTGLSPKVLAQLEEFLRKPYDPPDREDMKKGCKKIDGLREETRKKTGDLEVGVDLIRDTRNQ
jgi:hypothetical protein